MLDQDIVDRLAAIKAMTRDCEGAHGLEDELLWDFVKYLARRQDAIGRKARLILQSQSIDFPRWAA